MIGSKRAAIAASLLGALVIAGAPTVAFGDQNATHQAKAQSAATTSDGVTAQKAKDADDKKADDKKAADKKNDTDGKKASEKKNSDNKKDNKKDADDKKAAGKKNGNDERASDKKKDADDNKAADRKRHDNANKDDGKRDDSKKDDSKKNDHRDGDWKDKKHDDKWDQNWDHNRDRDHHRHDWDTHRRYYRYGYYGPGYYDDCGYYGSGYRGNDDGYSYYGPDACGYEYGGYRSHFLVDMSADQIPNGGARGAVGTANLDIDVPAGQVCFRLAYDGIDHATGAQIHPGRLGENGPSLVLLHVGENGDDGCVPADPRLLSEIQNNPRGYYLEVDDQGGPAMRGQLDAPDYRNRY